MLKGWRSLGEKVIRVSYGYFKLGSTGEYGTLDGLHTPYLPLSTKRDHVQEEGNPEEASNNDQELYNFIR